MVFVMLLLLALPLPLRVSFSTLGLPPRPPATLVSWAGSWGLARTPPGLLQGQFGFYQVAKGTQVPPVADDRIRCIFMWNVFTKVYINLLIIIINYLFLELYIFYVYYIFYWMVVNGCVLLYKYYVSDRDCSWPQIGSHNLTTIRLLQPFVSLYLSVQLRVPCLPVQPTLLRSFSQT